MTHLQPGKIQWNWKRPKDNTRISNKAKKTKSFSFRANETDLLFFQSFYFSHKHTHKWRIDLWSTHSKIKHKILENSIQKKQPILNKLYFTKVDNILKCV